MRLSRIAFFVVMILVGVASLSNAPSASTGAGVGADDPRYPANVRLESPLAQFFFRQVVARAGLRLRDARCQQVLTDFRDDDGRPLREELEATGRTPTAFLLELRWLDGSDRTGCKRNGLLVAMTSPGSQTVYVCSTRFADADDPVRGASGEMIVIHEMLHALGLSENPPSSRQITNQVTERCGTASL
jgi:hypothetical protein